MHNYWGTGRLGVTLATSFSTTPAATTTISTYTQKIRVITSASAYINVGSTSASTSDAYFAANVPEYLTISGNAKVSVISSVTATSGFLFVTEVS